MKRFKKVIIGGFIAVMSANAVMAQTSRNNGELTQTIRGSITDKESGEPIGFATVMLTDNNLYHATADSTGQFTIQNIPIGRHSIKVTFVGYEPVIYKEMLISSSKELMLDVRIKEDIKQIGEVIVRPLINKQKAINAAAVVGSRMFSVEETSRYAGGMDDPARMAGSFSGVSSCGTSNGISIHGNAPSLLSWNLEGIEVPNPNHYADISVLGGGILSSLSSHVLGNSDFLTCAFPAEYGNAVSGVFDMKMKTGNSDNYEHTFQAGILGIDVASEGPISRKNHSSYIVNYRYSALGLINHLGLADFNGEKLDYQDLNFKINLPTSKLGTFSVFGTALIDNFLSEKNDRNDWEMQGDEYSNSAKQYMFAGGINNVANVSKGGKLYSTLAYTFSKDDVKMKSFDEMMNKLPYLQMNRTFTNLIAKMAYRQKFSSRLTSKIGITETHHIFNMDMDKAEHNGEGLQKVYAGSGNTDHIEAYLSNIWNLDNNTTVNFGLNAGYLTLNKKYTVEPRFGISWNSGKRVSLAFGYGMHSRMEKTDVYYVRQNGVCVNKDLGFTKAHHFMISASYRLSDNALLRIEPYFQYLYQVPVEEGGSYSILNRTDFYLDKALTNKGKGKNYGVDITLERYLKAGWYYMVTGSVFNSKYCGGDKVWRNTRYNRHFIVNGLCGKEWMTGHNKQNMFSVNGKLTYEGGEYHSPVDVEATMADPDKEIKYDETRAFSMQFHPQIFLDLTVSYKINKKHLSHEFAVKCLNVTNTNGYVGYDYNLKHQAIETNTFALGIPNIYYKIEF